jgi:hypothetical protein
MTTTAYETRRVNFDFTASNGGSYEVKATATVAVQTDVGYLRDTGINTGDVTLPDGFDSLTVLNIVGDQIDESRPVYREAMEAAEAALTSPDYE